MVKEKRKKKCSDLWMNIEFNFGNLNKPDDGPTEVHQYIDYEDPEEGYHVKGVGPVTWTVTNPECDHY